MVTKNDNNAKFDHRLSIPLDFVCNILDVTREGFTTLALSNLIDEELDWIEHNGFHADSEDIKGHKETVKAIKFEANGWVINKK